MTARPIDRGKLRVALRKMDRAYLPQVLEEAIDLLPDAKLHKLVEGFADPDELRPDPQTRGSLLADVKAFEKASLAGKYYDAFRVNSKNHMEKSKGTQTWIAEHERLLDRCVATAGKGNPREVCQAIESLAALLDHIDECLDEIAGHEPKLWSQVGKLIAATQPKSYDEAVRLLVDLRDLAQRQGRDDQFRTKLEAIHAAHARKSSFIQRLRKAGL